ncbi:50S ribosomal protein L25/general stress protein Ctc [Mangrovibacillus cuniculi]|uniref:Large ribosomal subunit protein bL25 n=1 Tax=Mangrovibacillus cuniculi TaxID=2593652 RepID=A0A7S8HGJ5_9BACI|nr:50S ribosomal protein L25/general stress protein Ctc [Mangrovibacillus cuniculi]QPC47978.1 50S ribosomal protein L25/general stress protein Ctc [Mangrovibacillus cuniculi]
MTTLQAETRTNFKRSDLRKIREAGSFPAVVYGNNTTNTAIAVNEAEFIKLIREVGRNGIISLSIDGKSVNAVLTDYQTNPLKEEIVHADFLAVNKNSEIQADVRIDLIGESKGVKEGGVLQQPLHEVSVTAKAGSVPQVIEVDVTNLEIGDSIAISDISVPNGVTLNIDTETTVASILPPQQEEVIDSGEKQSEGEDDSVADEDGAKEE